MRSRIALLVVLFVGAWSTLAARIARADSPTAQMGISRGDQPHAGLPFTLHVVGEGFDESPAPEQPKLTVPGAQITLAGAEPSVSRSIQIVNGRRTDSTRVTWDFRYRVLVDKPGRIHFPAVTIVQGSKRATSNDAELELDTVPSTDDMKLELTLPDRPVFVGETVEGKLVWSFRRQPEDQSFSVPLFGMAEATVSAPDAAAGQRTITISAGSKELQLPYTLEQSADGWNRVTITFFVAPRQAGKLALPAASVVAALAVGRPDFFGQAPTRLFRATDAPRTFEVKALPETDKPAMFAGAVGTQFSMQVGTSRSVVQIGEPVELTITIKSNQRLDTLALARLDGPGGLPKDRFDVPAQTPTGELADDGKTKTFKVTAQVKDATTEIPALAFAYFDPVKGTYQTIHSDPIALSVKGGAVVGAGDVVSATPVRKSGSAAAAPEGDEVGQVPADLTLSSPSTAGDRPFGGALMWILVTLLYCVPLALFGVRTWRLRTAGRREEVAEVRAARRRVEEELARAAKAPARESAGPLTAALRNLARAMELEPLHDDGLLAKIETESFAPDAAHAPLSPDLRISAEQLVRRWTARRKPAGAAAKAAGAAAVLLVLFAPSLARADALATGRDAYQDAMALTDASARRAAFSRAEAALAEAVRTLPDRPELLADWGNAALGAGDLATATLAYRRALVIDGSNTRARRNLEWLRSRQSDAFRPASGGAADTLFFFHPWPRTRKLLVGAVAFAIAVLLVVPWSGRRRRSAAGLAILPFAVWLAMLVSLALTDSHDDDAIVMDSVVMRAADSTGAPPALSQSVPRGAEVTVLERRDTWTRVRIANGTAGWVPSGALERVH